MTEERSPKKRETLSEKNKATHEEHFLRSWLREDVEGKAKRKGEREQRCQRRRVHKWEEKA